MNKRGVGMTPRANIFGKIFAFCQGDFRRRIDGRNGARLKSRSVVKRDSVVKQDSQVTFLLHLDTPSHLFTTPEHTSDFCFTTDRSFENTVYYTVVKQVCPEILRCVQKFSGGPRKLRIHVDSGLVVEPSTHLRILRVSNT